MPRRNQNGFKRSYSHPDREKRNGRVLKGFRLLDGDDSSRLAGVVLDLERDGVLPELKDVPQTHRAFILDPRTVRKEFNQGFTQGYDFARTKQKIHDDGEPSGGDTVEAKIGGVTFLATPEHSRRHIVAYITSETMLEERRAIYGILGDEGLRGFQKREYRRPSAPLILLGVTVQPVHEAKERKEITEILETGLAIHNVTDLTFGELIIE